MYYKHGRAKNNSNVIVPVYLELGLLIAYGLGLKCLYPPKDKQTKGLRQFITHILVTNSAAFLLGYVRAMSVFLLQRMLWRRYELQADAYAAHMLNNPQAGIDFFKDNKKDPALIYKNYYKGSLKERLKFYWQEYIKHRQSNSSEEALCLTLMPRISCTHPDHAVRIRHLQKIIDNQ